MRYYTFGNYHENQRKRNEIKAAIERLETALEMYDKAHELKYSQLNSDTNDKLVKNYLEIAKITAPEFFKEATDENDI